MIDLQWQQILTHAVGFLIALWVLKKFAWKPLLSLMEERRNKIVEEFNEIDNEKAKVAELTAEYEAKLRDIESERRAKLVEAVDEGKKLAAEIKAKARRTKSRIYIPRRKLTWSAILRRPKCSCVMKWSLLP